MSKLFIIGNGFDIAHGLDTLYKDFRKFLKGIAGDNWINYSMPSSLMDKDGEIIPHKEATAGSLLNLIKNTTEYVKDWSDLEEATGKFDYDEYFWLTELDPDDDDGYSKYYTNIKETASGLKVCIPYIKDLFTEWIEQIDVFKAKTKNSFIKLYNKDDLFLNFNYTSTLEDVYNINKNNICHIHGRLGETLYFGHGEDEFIYNEMNFSYPEVFDDVESVFKDLRKRTDECLNKHSDFFIKIKEANITDIYFYGFGFSDVDKIYLKKLSNLIDINNVSFHLTEYDNKMHNDEKEPKNIKYREILKKYGFNMDKEGELIK